ncbi:helix-turn-helix domain-containing protein [Streptosporangium sp. NBC_01639]|uniref:helix-turn-helix domain-containing protein n=1 Tax=unclassified Streptosporangium TaxID=2632669 RepID=UPI002DD7B866|nr:helix-turn-helix domain-containing protein [Streptosporangium sp. NBC_01756]WSC84441.1 helix-turn-helix domain-containing protein [Streptosporangium sp. NBC_01756]WTD56933.1 helix-turn-helix domain-containing protein [Streptosporangium sp. NBC_01639]
MSIGSNLAEARRAAGLTVGQLSARTRVREALIHGIERDDFSQCGGDFYARGHVRNIAKVVGLDPEAMVHEYDELHGGVPLPVRAASVFQADTPIKIRESRSPNWTTAMAVALAIVVVFGVVKMMGGGGDDTPATVAHPASAPAVPPPAAAVDAFGRPKVPPVAGKRVGPVVLQVKAVRPAWLDVRETGGRKLFSGMMEEGKTSVWKTKKGVKVTFGDGGAFRLRVNGKNLGTPGPSGEVLTRSYGASAPEPG